MCGTDTQMVPTCALLYFVSLLALTLQNVKLIQFSKWCSFRERAAQTPVSLLQIQTPPQPPTVSKAAQVREKGLMKHFKQPTVCAHTVYSLPMMSFQCPCSLLDQMAFEGLLQLKRFYVSMKTTFWSLLPMVVFPAGAMNHPSLCPRPADTRVSWRASRSTLPITSHTWKWVQGGSVSFALPFSLRLPQGEAGCIHVTVPEGESPAPQRKARSHSGPAGRRTGGHR